MLRLKSKGELLLILKKKNAVNNCPLLILPFQNANRPESLLQ